MQEDNRVIYFLKRIWPTLYKLLNGAFYFLFTLLRGMVRMAIDQIRNF